MARFVLTILLLLGAAPRALRAEPPVRVLKRLTAIPVAGSPERCGADAGSDGGGAWLQAAWRVQVGGEDGVGAVVSHLARHGTAVRLDQAPDKEVRLTTRQEFRLEPLHTYRVSFLLGAAPGTPTGFGAVLEAGDGAPDAAAELRAWPRVHGSAGPTPDGRVESGFVVNGPRVRSARLFIKRGAVPAEFRDGRFPCFFSRAALDDCGVLRSDETPMRWTEGFDREGAPLDSARYATAFAKPGELEQTPVDGCCALRNTGRRGMVFGPLLPARFGDVYRMTLRVKGAGSGSLQLIPYIAPTGRFATACTATFKADPDQWSEAVVVVGQHVPAADTLRPAVDIWGDVAIDWLTVEGPLAAEPSR